jgi:chitin synthase
MGRDEVGFFFKLACLGELLINHDRKVEGEGKGEAHGAGAGVFDGSSVPLRRWEDWERSRLRKLKREERRRRDLERLHPGGFIMTENELLSARGGSQYDGSDTYSLASSEDDQWGHQVGGYNETSGQYPPPPVGLYDGRDVSGGEGKTLGGAELEAMLESGFDESPNYSPTPVSSTFGGRYQLSDNPSQQHLMGYGAMSRSGSSESPNTPSASSSMSLPNHFRGIDDRREYGPLGPLDPRQKF